MGSMEFRADELACIEAYCEKLSTLSGSRWRVVTRLDAVYPSEPSPECRISDGRRAKAVEVKGLYGPERRHFALVKDLGSLLAPRVPGCFHLFPPNDLPFPWKRDLVMLVRGQVEVAARSLDVGQSTYVRIPRKSKLVLERGGGSFVVCQHGSHPGLQELRGRVPAFFCLEDGDACPELHTPAAIRVLTDNIVAAAAGICRQGVKETTVDWFEEWPLYRSQGKDGLTVVVWYWGWEGEGLPDALWTIVAAASRKFSRRRWASAHVLVVFNQHLGAPLELVQATFNEIPSDDYAAVEEVWVFDGDDLAQVYPRATAPRAPSPPALA
jgi:hypothetical protein